MKRMIPVAAVAALAFTACNQSPRNSAPVAAAADTTGLAEFRAWKQQNELMTQLAAMQAAQAMANGQNAYYAPQRYSAPARRASSSRASSNRTVYTSESSAAAKAPVRKKGWSRAAKGAVIGGVAGGAAGAVINKRNRVAGGVVGAVIGAGGGYAIGRGMDKRAGRY